jgi:dynein heavy chain, axonemal
MELVVPMPILLFKPVADKQTFGKGIFECPLYMTQQRASIKGGSQLVLNVDLKTGSFEPEHWVLRGTALLLSLGE